MARLNFEVPNTLPVDDAKQRVEALLTYWQRKYGIAATWTGASAKLTGKAMGVSIDASLNVEDRRIAGEGPDPGFLLRGQATKYIQRKFGQYLDPTTPLDELKRRADGE